MPSESMVRSADRRADRHRAQIASVESGLGKLRRAVQWLLSEAHQQLPTEEIDSLVDTVTGLAEGLNERSRRDDGR